MIDNLSLLISHGLLALLCWRLLSRPDLDREPPSSEVPGTPVRAEPSEAQTWGRNPPTGMRPRDDA